MQEPKEDALGDLVELFHSCFLSRPGLTCLARANTGRQDDASSPSTLVLLHRGQAEAHALHFCEQSR